MIKTQYITLNMVPSGVIPVLHCSQYDIGRPLGVVVYASSDPVNLDNYTVTVEATRTDGVAVLVPVTTANNVGVLATTATMTNAEDVYGAQLILTSAGKRVGSIPFILRVIKAEMDENAEAIEEDASLFQQYTSVINAAVAEISADVAEISAAVSTLSADVDNIEADVETIEANLAKRRCDTVADMVADTTLAAGDYVRTGGYYAAGDGGGAYYRIVVSTSGHYEPLANGLVAQLLPGVTPCPEMYGAHGDGATDDSAAVQACLNQNAMSYLTASYKCNSRITLPVCHKVTAARRGTGLILSDGFVLSNFSEVRGGDYRTDGTRIFLIGGSGVYIDGVYGYGLAATAITYMDDTTEGTMISNCWFEILNGVYMPSRQIDIYMSNTRFTDFESNHAGHALIFGAICEAIECVNCNFISFSSITTAGPAGALKYSAFANCYFDNFMTQGVVLEHASELIAFNGCWFSGRSGWAIYANGCRGITVSGCDFASNDEGCIVLDGAQISVTGCNFKNNKQRISVVNNASEATIANNAAKDEITTETTRFVNILGGASLSGAITGNLISGLTLPAYGPRLFVANNLT